MTTGLIELAIVIVLAVVLGIIAELLKQPTILAYIVTGVVIALFGFFNFDNQEVLQVFSDMGIMFLLFLVGLEINYKSLRLVGKTSLIVGLGQILFTFLVGLGIAILFGFEIVPATYIAIGLTFSSTIIVVQLLSKKRAMNSLYGKISVGFLLVQDFIAILVLIFLAGIESGEGFSAGKLILTVVEGVILFVLIFYLGRKFFPYLFNKIARSQELLFLSSLAWLFTAAAITKGIGFSIEVGGFLAGLALANSSEHFEISSRIKPLRDFFIVVFFAILGSSVFFVDFSGLIWPIIAFSVFVLIGNPLIVLTIMGLLGHEKRTSFLSGLTVAQISEFSLIVAALGLKVGHLGEEVVALITAVGVITITVSTYFIVNADALFKFFSPYLRIFERKNKKKINLDDENLDKEMILIGCHRTGEALAMDVPLENILIIDFDPVIVSELRKKGYTAIFGDISDFEIFEKVDFSKAKMIISTSPNFDDNLMLVEKITKEVREDGFPKVIVRAEEENDAKLLYESGADYVLMPNFVSGHYLKKIVSKDPNLETLENLKEKDFEMIKREDIVT
jgi:Kef-type K+ transport system membrane component KefB/Trk K+ transport system NAD-binding subunit